MSCMRGSHGGMAAQAKRRNEQYLACLTCGQPHARLHLQAEPDWCDITTEHRHVTAETPADFARAFAVAVLLVVAGIAMTFALAGYAA